MKLKDILPYLYFGNKIKIEQYDCFIDKEKPEEIYFGYVLDVPWYIAEMYLYNTPDAESISFSVIKNEHVFEISVVEKPKNEK